MSHTNIEFPLQPCRWYYDQHAPELSVLEDQARFIELATIRKMLSADLADMASILRDDMCARPVGQCLLGVP